MGQPENLVDENIYRAFGGSSSIDVNALINEIILLGKNLPLLNTEKNFFRDEKREFIISKDPMESEFLYKNLSPYFSNCINWKSPRTQFNITPPVITSSVAASALVNLLNPNMVWDFASGGIAELERDISRYMAGLVGWAEGSGIYTFGGTGTDMYAIKIGINKSDKDALKNGTKDAFVISNNEGHSCHITICNWLGIGTNNCVRLKTLKEGTVNPNEILSVIEELLKEGKKVACIILNGGTNFNGEIDPIFEITKGIEELKNKYNLYYKPHVHVDSVIGWVFLLFKDYDFEKNELAFPDTINRKLNLIYNRIKEIAFADSFGVDFHKTGFCPYISSLFVLKDKKDWRDLTGDENLFTHQAFNFGDYKPGQFTLETSRPANGIITAYVTINTLGIDGIRKILASFLYLAEDLRKRIKNSELLDNCNYDALGWATIFIIKKDKKYPAYDSLYETDNIEIMNSHNKFQKLFYDFLIKKYNNKLSWNVGFCKSYKQNKYGLHMSALKNYPMSPFTTISDNEAYLNWLNKNLEEYINESDKLK